MIILLHSSKTMKPKNADVHMTEPQLIDKATQLNIYLKSLAVKDLESVMKISSKVAEQTKEKIDNWSNITGKGTPAIDTFVGDIYSGLQAGSFTASQRDFAHKHLVILSGLYGGLRPNDAVMPYRLEMGYRLGKEPYRNLYKFWGRSIVDMMGSTDLVINLAAKEYSQAVIPFLEGVKIIEPKFLTVSAEKNVAEFVVVHAKIARGAFAGWMIKNSIEDAQKLRNFKELNYKYQPSLSTPEQPVFVTNKFGGLGLSVRLA